MVGTATAAHVLSGVTFTSSKGINLTGSIANNGAWTNTPTAKGKVTIPGGYHSGEGYVDTTTVYNKGVTDADARTNTNSANYKAGYNAGKEAGEANNNIALIKTITTSAHYGWTSGTGRDTHIIDMTQYTSNYKNLSNDDFICCFLSTKATKNNISNTASQDAIVSITHHYDAPTGILTVYYDYQNGGNTSTGANIIYVYGVI